MKKNIKKIIILASTLSVLSFDGLILSAQSRTGSNLGTGSDLVIDNKIGLKPITIPLFSNFINFNTNNASVLTWLSFIGGLATIGLIVFWVYLLIMAGLKAMQSKGSAEGLEEAFKRARSIFVGAAITLFFPLVLSIVGLIFGIGTIFSWPKMFQLCNTSTKYQFYYQAYLDKSVGQAGAEAACNGSSNGT